MKHHLYRLFLAVCLLPCIFHSCSKKNNTSTPNPTLAVNGISPTHGSFGDTITITGTGFQSSPSLDSVWFNGKMASVITASASQLEVTVPSLCGTGNVKVSANGTSGLGPIFTYDTITKVTTFATGSYNPQYLTIDGTGNVYVTNFGNGAVSKISPAGVASTFASGLNGPTGITIDAGSNIYVATTERRTI